MKQMLRNRYTSLTAHGSMPVAMTASASRIMRIPAARSWSHSHMALHASMSVWRVALPDSAASGSPALAYASPLNLSPER